MNATGAALGVVRCTRLIVAELDAHGEIDSHAAMCLRFAIEGLLDHGAVEIVIDLRDLTAVDEQTLALLRQASGNAAAAGVPLGLLTDALSDGGDVTRVLQQAGLRVQTHIAPPRPQRRRPRSRSRARAAAPPAAGET